MTRRLPRRLGGILLARLADTLQTTRASIGAVGGLGLFANALHERAAAFYHRCGFETFRDQPLRLFCAVTWP